MASRYTMPAVAEGDHVSVTLFKKGGRGFSDKKWTETGTVTDVGDDSFTFDVDDNVFDAELAWRSLGPKYIRHLSSGGTIGGWKVKDVTVTPADGGDDE